MMDGMEQQRDYAVDSDMEEGGSSPFKPPNDEEVFLTRETEKQKKKEAKEKAKNMKIWDKKTASNRAPLRRVRDNDIEIPTKKDNTALYNNGQRISISVAMHITRSRVQYPRDERAQNMSEFVDQKKEMFQAELAYNTVQEEIKDLEVREDKRRNALDLSKVELESDKYELIKFVIDDNTTKKNKKDRETLKMQERQTKEDNLKNLESQIITVKSEIEKNKTALKDAIKYKDFLNNMDAEVAEKKKIEKEQKKEVFKQNWIKRMRNLPPSDSQWRVIFTDDEEIHGDSVKLQVSGTQQVAMGGGGRAQVNRGKGQNQKMNTNIADMMTPTDWSIRFEQLLSLYLIDVDDNYYNEELPFTVPEELQARFEALEDQNLNYIMRLQEMEEQLENIKDAERRKRGVLDSEYNKHNDHKNVIQASIDQAKGLEFKLSKQQKNTLYDTSSDGKQKPFDIEYALNDLNGSIKKIFCDVNKIPDGTDLSGKSELDMLTDIETQAMAYIEALGAQAQSEVTNKELLQYEGNQLLKYKNERGQQQTDFKNEENAKKNLQIKVRAAKTNASGGRMVMGRSTKREMQKKEKPPERDEDAENRLKYLGEIALTLDAMTKAPGTKPDAAMLMKGKR